ncbi:torsin-1A-interacting protein 2-like [Elysia marginata]|uniref:Torsin-1A-interacting protein 2-like n=1 Tax=Elysia marginata TaxID=1093978 RepID=A0AAV4FWV0_9GAST|nr:torsin-1A-interacting protein 2-like [Elysia marginata]
MPARSPVSPRTRSHRSPSHNVQSEELSESDGDPSNVSKHDHSLRYHSSQEESLQHDDDEGRSGDSYTSSPLQSKSKVRSSKTSTRGSSSTSPGIHSGTVPVPNIYPDLSDSISDTSGDGPSLKGAQKPVKESLYPDLPKDPKPKFRGRRPLRGMVEEEDHQEESSSYLGVNNLLFFLATILVAISAYIVFSGPSKPVTNAAGISVFEKYTSRIDELQKHFPKQSSRFWRTLKSSAKHVLNSTDPEYPVVILMAAPIQSSAVTRCVAEQVASVFQSSLTGAEAAIGVSDISLYQSLEDAKQKEALDSKMLDAFSQKSGGKSFVILNLQALAPEAALILHSYCDNDNAPFKDVMIVITLHFSPGQLELNAKQRVGEGDVEAYLRDLWNRGLVGDKVGALLSRVANNIVLVVEETSDNYRKVCYQ